MVLVCRKRLHLSKDRDFRDGCIVSRGGWKCFDKLIPKKETQKNLLPSFAGNLLDGESTLSWLLSQSTTSAGEDDGGLAEVSGPAMLNRLIRETRNLVVLFCKYAGYVVIALTHTCFLIKHFSNSCSTTGPMRPDQANGGSSTYMPPTRVKGMAMET